MITSEILTPWKSTQGANDQEIFEDYRDIALGNGENIRVTDTTHQANIPPSVNLFIVRVITGATTFAQIQVDPKYQILWADNESGQITSNEHSSISSYLSGKGVNASLIIGATPAGRTRGQVANDLRVYLRDL